MSSSAVTFPSYLDPTKAADGSAAAPSFAFANSTSTGIYRVSANTLGISTAGVQRVVVDSSGNVGVNVVPSAWVSSFKAIQIGSRTAVYQDSSADTAVANNAFNDGTNKYLTTSAASVALQSGGAHIWYNAPSGTAGTAISFTERMRLDASGNLLVGTADAGLTTGNGIKLLNSSIGKNLVLNSSASTNANEGYMMYSTGASAYRFYVQWNGQINATATSIVGISDISLKENIRDLETGLSQVLALKPRRFDWKEEVQLDQKNVAGFIAQEVEEVLPELVYEYKYNETETKKSLKMGDMLPTLVKAIQEQQAQIEEMKAKLAALEAKP